MLLAITAYSHRMFDFGMPIVAPSGCNMPTSALATDDERQQTYIKMGNNWVLIAVVSGTVLWKWVPSQHISGWMPVWLTWTVDCNDRSIECDWWGFYWDRYVILMWDWNQIILRVYVCINSNDSATYVICGNCLNWLYSRYWLHTIRRLCHRSIHAHTKVHRSLNSGVGSLFVGDSFLYTHKRNSVPRSLKLLPKFEHL